MATFISRVSYCNDRESMFFFPIIQKTENIKILGNLILVQIR
jgi:hypothetical protein